MRWFLFAVPFVLLVVVAAGCGGATTPTVELPESAAGPQAATLDWSERTAPTGEALQFTVRAFRVTADGWSADVGIANETSATWKLPGSDGHSLVTDNVFGAIVFPTGSQADAVAANEAGTVPPVRRATSIDPPLPAELAPGGAWRGTLSASGRLPAGLWVRLSFGPLWTTEPPPPGLTETIVWFTDHSLQLRRSGP